MWPTVSFVSTNYSSKTDILGSNLYFSESNSSSVFILKTSSMFAWCVVGSIVPGDDSKFLLPLIHVTYTLVGCVIYYMKFINKKTKP